MEKEAGIGCFFNSYEFMIFFPVVVSIYFIIPKRVKYLWLLVVSYYFYMSWNPKYAILIALSTVITYMSGILLGKCRDTETIKRKKLIVAGSVLSNLVILIFLNI